jgi:hypothetical protein
MSAFGLSPSPLIGELLRVIEEARMAGLVSDRDQAIQWANDHLYGRKGT